MLSGITHKTRVLCSNYAGLKWHFHLTPLGLYQLINIPSLSILKEMWDNNSVKHFMSKWQWCTSTNYIIYKLGSLEQRGTVTRPLIIPKCTVYESNESSSKNIPTFINFVHSRVLSRWQNLHTVLSVRPGPIQSSGRYSLANHRLYSCILPYRKRGLGVPFISSDRC